MTRHFIAQVVLTLTLLTHVSICLVGMIRLTLVIDYVLESITSVKRTLESR